MVDLPLPLSPTMAKISGDPLSSVKLTWLTAFSFRRESSPPIG